MMDSHVDERTDGRTDGRLHPGDDGLTWKQNEKLKLTIMWQCDKNLPHRLSDLLWLLRSFFLLKEGKGGGEITISNF